MRGSKIQIARQLKKLLPKEISIQIQNKQVRGIIRIATTPKEFVHMFSCPTRSCMDMLSNSALYGISNLWKAMYGSHHIHPAYFYGCCPQIIGVYACDDNDNVLVRCQIIENDTTGLWKIGSCYQAAHVDYLERFNFIYLVRDYGKLLTTRARIKLVKPFKVKIFKLNNRRYFPLPFSDDIRFDNSWYINKSKKSVTIKAPNKSVRKIVNAYAYEGYVRI